MPGREEELGRWIHHGHKADSFVGINPVTLTYPPIADLVYVFLNGSRARALPYTLDAATKMVLTITDFTPEATDCIECEYAY